MNYHFPFFLLMLMLLFGCDKGNQIQDLTFAANQETPDASVSAQPRILINGEILGFQTNTYTSPFFVGNNLMVDATYLMQRLNYDVSWDSTTKIWKASRKVQNQQGEQAISLEIGKKTAVVGTETYTMPVEATLSQAKVFVPARFLAQMGGCTILEWDKDSHSLQLYFYEELEYGVYFYGKQNGNADAVGAQKFVAGQPNAFFDPSKPTIIYTHGWQLDGVKNKGREDFSLKNDTLSLQTQNFWIDKGWNVGIFNWVQLADDGGVPPPREAEAKIYDINNTLAGMRWKRTNGSQLTHSAVLPTQNVSELYANAYQTIFGQNFSGNEIRLIGNSLGGNLTLAMLMELHHRNVTYMPQRVTLIDPYWSLNLTSQQVNFPYNYTSAYDLATASAEIQRDQYGTAIEYLRTSVAGAVGTSEGVISKTAFSHFGTDYSWNVINKHTVPVRQYMWSIEFAAPQEIYRPNVFTPFTATGNVAGSAATSNARIRELMRADKYWNHIEGRATLTPGDDKFEIRDGLY